MRGIIGITLVILAVLGGGYAWLNRGADDFATRRDGAQAIVRAETAIDTYRNDHVKNIMKGYITVLRNELAKDNDHMDKPTVKMIIIEVDKAIKDLQAHPPRRSALPDAPPLGSPTTPRAPPLGPAGSGLESATAADRSGHALGPGSRARGRLELLDGCRRAVEPAAVVPRAGGAQAGDVPVS